MTICLASTRFFGPETIAHCARPATKATAAKPKVAARQARHSEEVLYVFSSCGVLLNQSKSRQNRENIPEMVTTVKLEEPDDLGNDEHFNCLTFDSLVKQEPVEPSAAVESHDTSIKWRLRSNGRANRPENVCDRPGWRLPGASRAEVAPVKTILVKKEVEDDPCTQEGNHAKARKLQRHKLGKSRRSRNRRKRPTSSLTEATTIEPCHSIEQEESEHQLSVPQHLENCDEKGIKFRLELSEEDYCHALADCFDHNQMLRDIRNKGPPLCIPFIDDVKRIHNNTL
ncbi:hypothetical protein Aduo_007825 [Ancylostoma duodenale]